MRYFLRKTVSLIAPILQYVPKIHYHILWTIIQNKNSRLLNFSLLEKKE